jgi:hypothetical protein
MFMRKRRCMNPYLTIMLCTMAAVGVVCMVDKGRCLCNEAMEAIKEKMPMSIMHPKED